MGKPKATIGVRHTRRRLDDLYCELLIEFLVPQFAFKPYRFPEFTPEEIEVVRQVARCRRAKNLFTTASAAGPFAPWNRRPAHRSLADEASPGQEVAIRRMEDG